MYIFVANWPVVIGYILWTSHVQIDAQKGHK